MNNITPKILPPRVFNLKGWIELTDEKRLEELFGKQLQEAGFKILDYSSHQFPMNGFTAFWLLAESHLALHTFTESGWCYIELSSCNAGKTEAFKNRMNEQAYAIKWENEQLEISSATS